MTDENPKTIAVTRFFKVNQDKLKQVMKSYIIIGKDEVAGSNLAISSIEILQEIAGFRFFMPVFAGFDLLLMQFGDLAASNCLQNQSFYQY